MAETGKRAAALGIFDGVHLGHRNVLGYPKRLSEKGLIPAVYTFRSGSIAEKQGRRLEYIYTDENKERIMMELGIAEIISDDFESVRMLSGEEFARDVLVKRLGIAAAVCGGDFRFGHKASCGAAELVRLGKRYGFEVIIAEDAEIGGERVSSRRIRTLLGEGDMRSAAELLGADYCIYGEVVRGAQLGRTIGFPTINQLYEEGQIVPAYGVYASRTVIGGRAYPSMTNIGVKPTVKYGGAPLAETHIIGFSGDLYGEHIRTELSEYIRPEKKFGSVDELKRRIAEDIEKCSDIYR